MHDTHLQNSPIFCVYIIAVISRDRGGDIVIPQLADKYVGSKDYPFTIFKGLGSPVCTIHNDGSDTIIGKLDLSSNEVVDMLTDGFIKNLVFR